MEVLLRKLAMAVGLAAAGLLAANPAAAQSWEIQRDEAQSAMMAVASWPGGYAVAARCQAGDFQLIVRLPALVSSNGIPYLQFEDQSRVMLLSLPHGAETGRILFAQEPARAARWLAGGGQLAITTAASDPVALALPTDAEPVRSALRACDRPEVDARDDLPSAGPIQWRRIPDAMWPQEADSGTRDGLVTLSCIVVADGWLQDCRAERESPPGQGFAEAAISAATRAVLEPAPGEELVIGGVARFTVRFTMEN